jgi:hypothetical protein
MGRQFLGKIQHNFSLDKLVLEGSDLLEQCYSQAILVLNQQRDSKDRWGYWPS